jgi:hypothetical protein
MDVNWYIAGYERLDERLHDPREPLSDYDKKWLQDFQEFFQEGYLEATKNVVPALPGITKPPSA